MDEGVSKKALNGYVTVCIDMPGGRCQAPQGDIVLVPVNLSLNEFKSTSPPAVTCHSVTNELSLHYLTNII